MLLINLIQLDQEYLLYLMFGINALLLAGLIWIFFKLNRLDKVRKEFMPSGLKKRSGAGIGRTKPDNKPASKGTYERKRTTRGLNDNQQIQFSKDGVREVQSF
jgi:hypothetical protein